MVEILQETGEPDSEPSNETSKTEQVKSQYAQCKVCDDVMKISKYKQHMAKHRNQKLFNCEQCMEGFNVEDNLKLHMALHSDGDPQCPVCERKFQRYASLKAHLLVHKVEETFNCYECSAEFEREVCLVTLLHNFNSMHNLIHCFKLIVFIIFIMYCF